MDTGITVTGVGSAAAPPNVMALELGAEVTAAGVQEALEEASAALDRMRRALLDGGVPAADVSSGDVSVWPTYDDRRRVIGYTATLHLAAVVRDLDGAGALVSRTVGAGGDAARVFGMALRHSDPAGLLEQARTAAWQDATARARQYAELAGRTLGPVLAVYESVSDRPHPIRAFAAAGMPPPGMPVEPGSAEVRVSVDVRWELG
jgi:uncharacterized protein